MNGSRRMIPIVFQQAFEEYLVRVSFDEYNYM